MRRKATAPKNYVLKHCSVCLRELPKHPSAVARKGVLKHTSKSCVCVNCQNITVQFLKKGVLKHSALNLGCELLGGVFQLFSKLGRQTSLVTGGAHVSPSTFPHPTPLVYSFSSYSFRFFSCFYFSCQLTCISRGETAGGSCQAAPHVTSVTCVHRAR